MKRLPAYFYALPSGREPVRDWLKGLSADDRKIVGEDIKDMEFAWPIGMPLCRSIGRGVWEVRSTPTQGRIARVLFCEHNGLMVLLHQKDAKDVARRFAVGDQANEGHRMKKGAKKKAGRIGSSFDDFLKSDGTYETVTARAIKRVLARQLGALMKREEISKTELASRMKTSRAQLDRLLDPDNDSVTLGTLTRAAQAVGRNLRLELV
jgi:hypothetical protein